MKWMSYCITCNVNLATQKPRTTTGVSGSMVESFAVYHLKHYPDHRVLIGYLFTPVETDDELEIITELEKHID